MNLEDLPRTGIGARSECGLRVRYAETDAMGIAHHAEYLAWMEVGRTEWIRHVGGPDARGPRSYRRLESSGYLLPVVDVSLRYRASARYDDDIIVSTILADASRARLTFDYDILLATGRQLLATGRSVHAVTDRLGKPRRMPPGLFAWLLGEGGVAPEDAPGPGEPA